MGAPTKAQREAERHRLMLKLARVHDRLVSERERGAELAIKCGNGMATHYWREQAKAAERHFARPALPARCGS